MNLFQFTSQSEQKYRDMTICPACRKPKDTGLLCCWSCFKYRDNPFKYYKADFESWLNEVRG